MSKAHHQEANTMPAKHTLTDEERAARRAQERELVRQSVDQLRSSDGWQAWLDGRQRFHHYSLGNQLLIASQAPEAIRVAGFKKWLELGYCVRKGEHALRIFAPCPPSKKEIEQAKARGEDPRPVFFKLAPVFGDDQVDPLPEPAQPVPLSPPIEEVDGDSLAEVWQPLVQLAADIGSQVSIDDTGRAGGYYSTEDKRIVISETSSVNGRVKTLVHELAHALVRADRQDGDPTLTYAQEELVVESIAYSISGTLGLDTSSYSIPYLTAWSTSTDLDVIEKTAHLIDRLANRIEHAIEA